MNAFQYARIRGAGDSDALRQDIRLLQVLSAAENQFRA
jgi:hypothetical protein